MLHTKCKIADSTVTSHTQISLNKAFEASCFTLHVRWYRLNKHLHTYHMYFYLFSSQIATTDTLVTHLRKQIKEPMSLLEVVAKILGRYFITLSKMALSPYKGIVEQRKQNIALTSTFFTKINLRVSA